jgi:hypothetical protein
MNPAPIERLLDDLFDRLTGTGAAGRRALAEAEDHLTTAYTEGREAGLSDTDAAEQAVRRFGNPASVASALRTVHGGPPLRPLLSGAWLLTAFGLLAIGVSGLLAELLGRVVSAGFVAGDPSGVTYTAARCADYFEYFPKAATCGDAAALHHWGEVVVYRVAAGVLGLLALAVYALLRRVGPFRTAAWTPPPGPFMVVAVAVFGLTGALLTLPSAMELAFGGTSGVGANLSGGVVALLVACVAALLALRIKPGSGSVHDPEDLTPP